VTASGEAPNESATEALNRARDHARSALAEAIAAIHALLDATAQALSGEPAKNHRVLSPLAAILERLSAEIDTGGGREAAALLHSIATALDQEIARWEARAETDPDARAVLRAFLGLRELLWEFGVRRDTSQKDTDKATKPPRKADRPSPSRSKKRRVERIPVEGS
jgi:hypothetical protein